MTPTTPIPIALILSYPKDTPIPLVQGNVKKQHPRKTSKPGAKPWTCDTLTISDHSGEIDLKLWNRQPLGVIPPGTPVMAGCTDDKQNVTLDHFTKEDGTLVKSLRIEATALLQFAAAPQPAPAFHPQAHPPAPGSFDFRKTFPPAPLAPVQPPPDFHLPYPPPDNPLPAPPVPVEDPIEYANRRTLELGGLQYHCLRIVRHNMGVLAADGIGLEFNGDNVTSAAAVLMIQLAKEGITGAGFTLPNLPTPRADS